MKKRKAISAVLAASMLAAVILPGCGSDESSGKTEIEILQYKPEAATYFDQVEDQFNATHDDIHLTISSPNDATTILRTRFIREDYPDIIGIGGDINYSYYLDADILEITPKDGTYGVPYVANAAGILYNRDMFEEHGWEIPESWDELMALCEEIEAEGILPFYFGFRDTWTCLAPWNSLAVDLAPADTCQKVNAGETTFSEEYVEVAEKCAQLVSYGPDDPFAYGYNDACTAFANGESAMYPIGSYAVPQILSVNPEMNIDSFVTPGNDDASKNTLNSGVDLLFAVTAECENKEAAYEVLDFLMDDANIQAYIDDQNAVPCKDSEFELAPMLDGMLPYIESGNMTDYQDHYYPSEMAADALIQTYLINGDVEDFLNDFDTRWQRYNRDIIRAVQEYNEEHGTAE